MMNVTAPEKTTQKNTGVVPFSLRDAPSLIEKAWPTAKISAETQRERNAAQAQTLTGLGSYWKGRKPLVLTRACVLASLMPATDNLERDIEIFELLMGIDNDAFGRRFSGTARDLKNLFPDRYSAVVEENGKSCLWRKDISLRDRLIHIGDMFGDVPYSLRLEKEYSIRRPEEIPESDLFGEIWQEVNDHLKTSALTISELVEQLGIMRFGRRPKFADTFSGSGSIPFEAARMGCDVYASDLNPVACMLTWGAFNIVGASPEDHARMKAEQERIVAAIDAEICAIGVEHDAEGNRAKVFLYCLETRCPRTGWMVPMAPSWIISKKRNVIARLVPDHAATRYEIEILTGVSAEEMKEAEQGTVRKGRLFHPMLNDDLGVTIKEIRGDYKDASGVNRNKLRLWDLDDIEPRSSDIWQERLYCIYWMDGKSLQAGKRPVTWFSAPTEDDIERENLIKSILYKNLQEWRDAGFIPEMEIAEGYNTNQPIRDRGWTHWSHLFNPRQLFMNSIVTRHSKEYPFMNLGLASVYDRSARTNRWHSGEMKVEQTFDDQAIKPLFNYGSRAWEQILPNLRISKRSIEAVAGPWTIKNKSAKEIDEICDIFVTDPPYADAVNYDEITEYFIAWLRKNPPAPFDEWIWDSRRNLAIKGEGQSFKAAMIDAYGAMTEHMSDNGLQIVQFTHQDAKTWSDMAQIFWGAGLQVVQDWYVSTEKMTERKKGGYVQGTHMIVLKKRQGTQSGYQDEIVHEIRDEVERQIKEMIGLNDQMDAARGENIFNDADLQMAGYAAALRVLTAYTKIDGVDMTREALRPRKKGEKTLVDELTEFAVQTANEFLVPEGLERDLWLELNGAERFYLKMTDIEEAGEAKLDQFQNFAKAFRVGDYDEMMASKSPNNAKLKTAVKLGKTSMAEGVPFGRDSIVRLALRGIWRVAKEDEVDEVLEELRELIPDYLRKRDTLRQIIGYVAAKREHAEPDEASAARILVTAIQTERI
jgi:adenine-specific DNA methylase